MDVLNIRKPIGHGLIKDFEDIDKVWHHCIYNELKVTPEEYPL